MMKWVPVARDFFSRFFVYLNAVMKSQYMWYAGVICFFFISLTLGLMLVSSLRKVSRSVKDPHLTTQRLASYAFLTPISLYIVLNMGNKHGLLDRSIVDAATLGIVLGVIAKLLQKPSDSLTVKVVVKVLTGSQKDVWIRSLDMPLGEVRQLIAKAFNVNPSNRISMESGRGTVVTDLSLPLSALLHESATTVDFFGYTSTCCYISISEEELESEAAPPSESDGDKIATPFSMMANPFRSSWLVGNRGDACYGDLLEFSAKIPHSTTEKLFSICQVDKFAAVSPTVLTSNTLVRFISWEAIHSGNDNASEVNDHSSHDGSSTTAGDRKNGHAHWTRKFPLPGIQQSSGIKIKNGDIVVIECDGKFMSVTRGWWLAWTATSPRRSGAFVVEITERAPQNSLSEQLKESFGNFREIMRRPSIMTHGISQASNGMTQGNIASIQQQQQQQQQQQNASYVIASNLTQSSNVSHVPSITGVTGQKTTAAIGAAAAAAAAERHNGNATSSSDESLNTGDYFRLRSVKFPEYELGITHVKIRDDFCYMGLRKINDKSHGNEWCMGVNFGLTFHTIVQKNK